jgi:N6-L-threonylcarbamoyladenine synthase
VQDRIVSILLNKLKKAVFDYKISEVAIAGGVSANSGLRKALEAAGKKHGWKTYIPQFQYCTDNAAMIAMTAHFKYLEGSFCSQETEPLSRYKF